MEGLESDAVTVSESTGPDPIDSEEFRLAMTEGEEERRSPRIRYLIVRSIFVTVNYKKELTGVMSNSTTPIQFLTFPKHATNRRKQSYGC
jgi:hypothetical protein